LGMGGRSLRRRSARVQETRLRDALRRGQRVVREVRSVLCRHPSRGGRPRETFLDLIDERQEITMITQGDDYPIHQTPEPVQQVFTSDRNFYDRFFFNGYFREGEPYFAAAMGIYPNVGIIDAAFSVIVGGVQHCVRASRALGSDRLDTKVGPISVEIGQPMRSVRLRIDHSDIKADLEFQARAHAIEEPRFTRRNPEYGRLMMDLTRFTQHGGYAGKLTVGGKTFDAAPSRVWGSRDRSWGVRPVGPQAPGVPDRIPFQFF